jgi:hypothetical protein
VVHKVTFTDQDCHKKKTSSGILFIGSWVRRDVLQIFEIRRLAWDRYQKPFTAGGIPQPVTDVTTLEALQQTPSEVLEQALEAAQQYG